MKEREQGNIEYKRPSVQRTTNKEVNRKIYRALYNRKNYIN